MLEEEDGLLSFQPTLPTNVEVLDGADDHDHHGDKEKNKKRNQLILPRINNRHSNIAQVVG
jgi:hypothetical protein